MIVYKSVASPKPPKFTKDWTVIEKQTVPDQSLTLREILDRFTRKEALPIGRQVSYNDEIELDSPFAIDLEKLTKADILDQMEHAENWKNITDVFKTEEAARQKAAAKKAAEEAAKKDAERVETEVQKRLASAKQSSEKPAV